MKNEDSRVCRCCCSENVKCVFEENDDERWRWKCFKAFFWGYWKMKEKSPRERSTSAFPWERAFFIHSCLLHWITILSSSSAINEWEHIITGHMNFIPNHMGWQLWNIDVGIKRKTYSSEKLLFICEEGWKFKLRFQFTCAQPYKCELQGIVQCNIYLKAPYLRLAAKIFKQLSLWTFLLIFKTLE